jgi:hypothetical protein
MKSIEISLFNHTDPKRSQIINEIINVDFDKLADIVTKRMWSPGIFQKAGRGFKRSNKTWVATHLLCYDIDEGLTIDDAKQKLSSCRFFIGTTKSHQIMKGSKVPCDRFRIVILLSETIKDSELYNRVWINVKNFFELPVDEACKDPARFYYPCKEVSYFLKGDPLVVENFTKIVHAKTRFRQIAGANDVTVNDNVNDKRDTSVGDFKIGEGFRRKYLVKRMGRFRGLGFSYDAITEKLHIENRTRCHPPLETIEVDEILYSMKSRPFEEVALFAPYTDLGNAERFHALYNTQAIFVEKMSNPTISDRVNPT